MKREIYVKLVVTAATSMLAINIGILGVCNEMKQDSIWAALQIIFISPALFGISITQFVETLRWEPPKETR